MFKFCRVFLVVAIIALSSGVARSSSIALEPDIDKLEISNQVEIYLDDSRALTIDDVQKSDFTGFKRNTTLYPSFGAFSGRVWVRFTLENTSSEALDTILVFNAPLQEAQFHFQRADGLPQSFVAGRLIPEKSEVWPNRFPAFPISLPPQSRQTFYLSGFSDLVYSVKLMLHTPHSFFQAERKAHYFAGFYIGVLAIMILYNLFLYISTRDGAFLWYVLTLFFLHGGAVSVSITNNELFATRFEFLPESTNVLMKTLGSAFFIQFSRVFLHTQKVRGLDWFFKFNLALTPFFLLLPLVMPVAKVNALQNVSLLSSVVACIVYSGLLFGRGVKYARYYFIAWLPFLLIGLFSVITNLTKNAHLFPNLHIPLALAALAEVLLLSMALGDKINELREEREKADRLYRDTVLEMNRSLEEKVKEKTREVRSMLDNLKLGIFTVDENLKMGPAYSRHLATMVSARNLESQDALQCLFDGASVGRDLVSQVEAAMVSSIHSDDLGFIGNEHLLIREIQKEHQGKSVDLEIDWSPIMDEDEQVEKLLVSIKDVTLLNSLKRESAEQRKRIDMVSQYLCASRDDVQHLELSLTQLRHRVSRFVEESDTKVSKSGNFVDELFRDMHTLKAQARMQKLSYLADVMHDAEEYLQSIRREKLTPDPVRLEEMMASIAKTVAAYHAEIGTLGIQLHNGSESKKSLTFEAVILGVLEERRTLATALHKPIPAVYLDIEDNVSCPPEVERMLKDALLHLVRNSLDHGIEEQAERQAEGKSAHGTLKVKLFTSDQSFTLEYSDDGRGLDLDRIYDKARQKGILPKDLDTLLPEDVAAIILEAGFSTKDQVTDISGRGVGMDAIRQYLSEAGGKIEIVLDKPLAPGRWGRHSVRFVLRWPRSGSQQESFAA